MEAIYRIWGFLMSHSIENDLSDVVDIVKRMTRDFDIFV
jgi:hypothetical protein